MGLEIIPFLIFIVFIGCIHALLGPDHYLPFIAMAKAHRWSIQKTSRITLLCGLGHLFSSLLIAFAAMGLRLSLEKLHIINSYRGDLAAWMLIAFGGIYLIRGARKAFRSKDQASSISAGKKFGSPHWILFVVFAVGPCEPLFFLMTHPLVGGNPFAAGLLISVFSAATIMTMLTVVLAASFGMSFTQSRKQPRFSYAVLGLVMVLCGFGIKFLGM